MRLKIIDYQIGNVAITAQKLADTSKTLKTTHGELLGMSDSTRIEVPLDGKSTLLSTGNRLRLRPSIIQRFGIKEIGIKRIGKRQSDGEYFVEVELTSANGTINLKWLPYPNFVKDMKILAPANTNPALIAGNLAHSKQFSPETILARPIYEAMGRNGIDNRFAHMVDQVVAADSRVMSIGPGGRWQDIVAASMKGAMVKVAEPEPGSLFRGIEEMSHRFDLGTQAKVKGKIIKRIDVHIGIAQEAGFEKDGYDVGFVLNMLDDPSFIRNTTVREKESLYDTILDSMRQDGSIMLSTNTDWKHAQKFLEYAQEKGYQLQRVSTHKIERYHNVYEYKINKTGNAIDYPSVQPVPYENAKTNKITQAFLDKMDYKALEKDASAKKTVFLTEQAQGIIHQMNNPATSRFAYDLLKKTLENLIG